MSEKQDRPAFPVVANNNVYSTGMTLRDYFAGQILMGFFAKANGGWNFKSDPALIYQIADAMLLERSKTDG